MSAIRCCATAVTETRTAIREDANEVFVPCPRGSHKRGGGNVAGAVEIGPV